MSIIGKKLAILNYIYIYIYIYIGLTDSLLHLVNQRSSTVSSIIELAFLLIKYFAFSFYDFYISEQ